MANSLYLQTFLLESMEADNPLVAVDPVYLRMKTQGVLSLINYASRSRGFSSIDLIPMDEESNVIIIAKKEIYMRLATSTAPEWDLETEFTKILKSKRFDHYIKLVAAVQAEINSLVNNGKFFTVNFGEVTIASRDHTTRNYDLATSPAITVIVKATTANSIDIVWDAYAGNNFLNCNIYVGSNVLYDEFLPCPLQVDGTEKVYSFADSKRSCLRVDGLSPATTYNVVIIQESRDHSKSIGSVATTTL